MIPVFTLPLIKAIHASKGSLFSYVSGITYLHVPLALPLCGSWVGGVYFADRIAVVSLKSVHKQMSKSFCNAI